MCGIAGIVAPGQANIHAVRAMTDLLRYRGPDGDGFWLSHDGHCALGHRRLAIIDLSPAGAQPMELRELQLALTFNGEIYNYLELRTRLARLGHRFHSNTDTEVLLHAYAEWGQECLAELNGMFAFALWDGRKRSLLCARDRFGEKPFVYAWVGGGGFAFASEAKALGVLNGLDASIDDGVLARYAIRGSTWLDASERTLVRGVRQLMPAHALMLKVSPEGMRVDRQWTYWNIDVAGRHAAGTDAPTRAAEDLISLLTDSVRLRLRSDVPVGSCLSGGVDSSTVVSLMRRLEPAADLRTFTGRFPGDALDEGRFARIASDHNRTIAKEVEPTPDRFEREAQRLYWHAEFPVGGMSQFAQWCVFHLASEHGVTVLLDGQGSDEQFGGYGWSIDDAYLGQLWSEHRWRMWLHERRALSSVSPKLFSWPRLALRSTPLRVVAPALRRASGRSVLQREMLFRREWMEASRNSVPPDEVCPEPTGPHALSRVLWLLTFRTMLSGLLRFGDRLSMAHSREVRLPFCDHRIAEFAFALSPELLVGDGQVKRILRLAIQGLVPSAIATRKKQGFLPPQERWLVGPLAGWVRDLADAAPELLDVLDAERIRRVTQASHTERQRDVAVIWEASNLLAWARYSLKPLGARAAFQAVVSGEQVHPAVDAVNAALGPRAAG